MAPLELENLPDQALLLIDSAPIIYFLGGHVKFGPRFKPLFEALSPADVNKLAYEIISVFQGEGGTLEGLLAHTASVTTALASRDQVIGRLIPGDTRNWATCTAWMTSQLYDYPAVGRVA